MITNFWYSVIFVCDVTDISSTNSASAVLGIELGDSSNGYHKMYIEGCWLNHSYTEGGVGTRFQIRFNSGERNVSDILLLNPHNTIYNVE